MPELEVEQVKVLPDFAKGFIFNSPKFASLKSGKHLFFLLNRGANPVARIWFKIDGERAISGAGATFGSFDTIEEWSVEEMHFFLTGIIKMLKKKGFSEVVIKHWPEHFSTINSQSVFFKAGFVLKESERNQHLVIAGSYNAHLRHNEKKKLAQAVNKEFSFKKLPPSALNDVYNLVKETRLRKAYPVSMTFDELQRTINAMPDNYLLFGLYDHNKLIAASVSIRVSRFIMYNFYHADDLDYRPLSPLVMLVGEIYRYSAELGIKILDLGISSDNGKLNEGLYTFKRNLGCLESAKNTYILQL